MIVKRKLEIVEESELQLIEQKALIRKWWKQDETFATIEEDAAFDNLLENNFEDMLLYASIFTKMPIIGGKKFLVSQINSDSILFQLNQLRALPLAQKTALIEKFIKGLQETIDVSKDLPFVRNRLNSKPTNSIDVEYYN